MSEHYVLVVDDDPHTRMLIYDALAVLGYQARKARNGREALDMVRQERPDGIVLDMMMPEMNGFSMLAALQRETGGQSIPVVVLSALVDQTGPLRKLPGVRGVMCKGDFSMEEFGKLLQQAGIAA